MVCRVDAEAQMLCRKLHQQRIIIPQLDVLALPDENSVSGRGQEKSACPGESRHDSPDTVSSALIVQVFSVYIILRHLNSQVPPSGQLQHYSGVFSSAENFTHQRQ